MDLIIGNIMKKTTTYTIIGCNHRFTGEDEMYCKNCGLTKTECLDSIAVGERAYIYRKTTL